MSAAARSTVDVAGILKRLGIDSINAGAWSGTLGWSKDVAGSAASLPVNPATGDTLAQVRGATVTDYEAVMRSAVEAAAAWRTVPAPRRGEAIRLLGDALRAAKDDLGALVTLENGKIKAEGLGEVQEMIDIADFAVGQSRMLYGLHHALGAAAAPHVRAVASARRGGNHLGVQLPGGRLGLECFPRRHLRQCFGVEALPQDAARRAIAVQHICNKVMREHKLPAIFQLFIDGGTELATRFVDDRRVALVSFTGSTAVGRKVAERVARRLGKVLLELGGNNAIIVDESADLNLAVPAIVFGAVGTAGQRCTTTRRVLVHARALAELEKKLAHAYAQVRIGNPIDPGTLMGPLIDKGAVERYSKAIAQAKRRGRQGGHGREGARGQGQLRGADYRSRRERLAHRAARDVRAGAVPDSLRLARRGHRHAERVGARPVVRHLHRSPAARGEHSCRPRAATAASPT